MRPSLRCKSIQPIIKKGGGDEPGRRPGTFREIEERVERMRTGLAELTQILHDSAMERASNAAQRHRDMEVLGTRVEVLEGRMVAAVGRKGSGGPRIA